MANDGLVPLRKDILEILVLVIMVSELEPQINASCLSQRLATTKCDNLERLKAMHRPASGRRAEVVRNHLPHSAPEQPAYVFLTSFTNVLCRCVRVGV